MCLQEDELWYLKPDDAIEALGKGTVSLSPPPSPRSRHHHHHNPLRKSATLPSPRPWPRAAPLRKSSTLPLLKCLPFQGGDVDSLASTVSMMGDQQLMFNINQLIVTVEAGIGNSTIPLILLESKVFGEVRNWSGRLSVVTTIQLEVIPDNVLDKMHLKCVSITFRLRTTTRSLHCGSQCWSLLSVEQLRGTQIIQGLGARKKTGSQDF